jgi:hypothetical protein
VAGIGAAAVLRLSARQRKSSPSRARDKSLSDAMARARAAESAAPAGAAATAASAAAAPALPLDPVQAHKAKLAALQAVLALGDAKAERDAKAGRSSFADTQALDDDDDYAATQFVDRGEAAAASGSLMNLDRPDPVRQRRNR